MSIELLGHMVNNLRLELRQMRVAMGIAAALFLTACVVKFILADKMGMFDSKVAAGIAVFLIIIGGMLTHSPD